MKNDWIRFGIDDDEAMWITAEYMFACNIGLIEDASPAAVCGRRDILHGEIADKLKHNEPVYGLTHYDETSYLQYERTGFLLDFVSEKKSIRERYAYHEITAKDEEDFYHANPDLFTRYAGDSFSLDEVRMIIKKRIRETEYADNVQNILRQLDKR